MRHLLPTLIVLAAGACGGSSAASTPASPNDPVAPGTTTAPPSGSPVQPTAPVPAATPAPAATSQISKCFDGYEASDTVRAIAGSSRDLWAVGLPGTVVRYDGASWTSSCLAEPIALAAVWSVGPSDAWAAGGQAIYRWNGSSWTRANLTATVNGTFGSIWGSSPRDVWILAEDVAVHWDGQAFSTTTLADMRSLGFPFGAFREVWGTSASDVWIAADRGTLHWDGSAWWGSLAAPEDDLLNSVWADGAQAWTVGVSLAGGGAAWHWHGGGWTEEEWSGGMPQLAAVRGAPTGELFFQTPNDLIVLADGATRRLAPPVPPAGAPLVIAANDVWLPDARGVAHWDGASWTRSLEVPR